MCCTVPTLIAVAIFALMTVSAHAGAEIVIAIRYLQADGASHSHLYLFREDGKLLRQLTNDNSGQDSTPIFSADGETIVFTREKTNDANEIWSIEAHGTNLKKLDVAPDWYFNTKSSPYFTNIEPEKSASPAAAADPTYKSPDGSFELLLREDRNDESDQIDEPGHGKHYLLRDLKNGTETEFDKNPWVLWRLWVAASNPAQESTFLFDGPLRVTFLDLHLNSTDGDTVFALDLTSP